MEPYNPGDLQNITNATGWEKGPDGKTTAAAIAMWCYGTGIDPKVWADQHTVHVNLDIELYNYGKANSGGEYTPYTPPPLFTKNQKG